MLGSDHNLRGGHSRVAAAVRTGARVRVGGYGGFTAKDARLDPHLLVRLIGAAVGVHGRIRVPRLECAQRTRHHLGLHLRLYVTQSDMSAETSLEFDGALFRLPSRDDGADRVHVDDTIASGRLAECERVRHWLP